MPTSIDSPPPDAASPLVAMRGISKHFGAVQALSAASVEFRPGEVHALVGANGAGKSTLINVLAGVVEADAGAIAIDGEEVRLRHPSEASARGLTFIHQELNLVPKFSVLENMTLGHVDSSRVGFVKWKDARARARTVLERLGATFPLDVEVDRLSVNQRWMVSLGHALMRDARLVAMDEPTASFTDAEVHRLFEVIRELQRHNVAVVYVSHRLEEVLEVSQEVSVFRNGEVIGTFPTPELDRAALANLIVGHTVSTSAHPPQPAANRRVVLGVSEIVHQPAVRGVSFDVAEGEIVGIAGLVGSGRTETAHIIAGLARPTSGTMTLSGSPYAPRSSYDAVRRGVAYLPEERRSQGLVVLESVDFNVNMAAIAANRLRPWLPFVSARRSRAAARRLIERFSIKTSSARTPVAHLSGGNQQKVVLGKCVQAGPRLLILDEPTVGVDIGAREDIYRHIASLAEGGTAVVLISSDFEELIFCHRVIVMREGRVTQTVVGEGVTKANLTHLCYEEAV